MYKTIFRSFMSKLIVFLLVPILMLMLTSSSAYSESIEYEKYQEPLAFGYCDGYKVVLSSPCPYKSESFSIYLSDADGNIRQCDLATAYNLSFETEDELNDTMRNLNSVLKSIFEEYSYEDITYGKSILNIYQRFRDYLDTNNYSGNEGQIAKFTVEAFTFYEEEFYPDLYSTLVGGGDEDFEIDLFHICYGT